MCHAESLHLVMQPRRDGDLARWAHWLFTTHARRYHRKYNSSGRVWQGRFKASVVQAERHFLILLRYVERNALTARLVARAEDWEWGSLRWRLRGGAPNQARAHPFRYQSWSIRERAADCGELEAIRTAVERQAPYGDERWCHDTARRLRARANAFTARPSSKIDCYNEMRNVPKRPVPIIRVRGAGPRGRRA